MVGMAAGRSRGMVLLFAAGLVVTACSGDTTEPTTTRPPTTTAAPTTTVATTTTTSTTTTTVAPTTTTIDPLARPEVLVSNVNRDSIDDFDTSKANVYEAAMELRDLFVFLEGNPTDNAEEMMSLLFERDYTYWNSIMVGFLELTDNPGWHYVDPGVETLGVELVSATVGEATFRFAYRRDTQVIADAVGELVKTYDGWPLRASEITFRRGADLRWRYSSAQPWEPMASDAVASMVPVEWSGRRP